MTNFSPIIPNMIVFIGIGIILAISAEVILYIRVKTGIINKLGFPILLFALFCSLITAFCAFALTVDQETFIHINI